MIIIMVMEKEDSEVAVLEDEVPDKKRIYDIYVVT